jgi:hypothetical protein
MRSWHRSGLSSQQHKRGTSHCCQKGMICTVHHVACGDVGEPRWPRPGGPAYSLLYTICISFQPVIHQVLSRISAYTAGLDLLTLLQVPLQCVCSHCSHCTPYLLHRSVVGSRVSFVSAQCHSQSGSIWRRSRSWTCVHLSLLVRASKPDSCITVCVL